MAITLFDALQAAIENVANRVFGKDCQVCIVAIGDCSAYS